ncbi:hypothetical protein PRNP1_013205 [Phytophthora ramorum]
MRGFLFMVVAVVFAMSSTSAATIGEQNTLGFVESKPSGKQNLRASKPSDVRGDTHEEERSVANTAKTLARSNQFVNVKAVAKQAHLDRAAELIRKGESYQAFMRENINPKQLYQALGLEKNMKNAWFHVNWSTLRQNYKYNMWRTYERMWTQAQRQKIQL